MALADPLGTLRRDPPVCLRIYVLCSCWHACLAATSIRLRRSFRLELWWRAGSRGRGLCGPRASRNRGQGATSHDESRPSLVTLDPLEAQQRQGQGHTPAGPGIPRPVPGPGPTAGVPVSDCTGRNCRARQATAPPKACSLVPHPRLSIQLRHYRHGLRALPRVEGSTGAPRSGAARRSDFSTTLVVTVGATLWIGMKRRRVQGQKRRGGPDGGPATRGRLIAGWTQKTRL